MAIDLPAANSFVAALEDFGNDEWTEVASRLTHGPLPSIQRMMWEPALSPVGWLVAVHGVAAVATGRVTGTAMPPGLFEAMELGQRAEAVAGTANATPDAIRAAGMTAMGLALVHDIAQLTPGLVPVAKPVVSPLFSYFPTFERI